jgi:hypothetical protein
MNKIIIRLCDGSKLLFVSDKGRNQIKDELQEEMNDNCMSMCLHTPNEGKTIFINKGKILTIEVSDE